MFVALACWVCKSPIIVKGPADIWTADITPHRNCNVRHGDLINRLAVLALFHIYAVKLHKYWGLRRLDLFPLVELN